MTVSAGCNGEVWRWLEEPAYFDSRWPGFMPTGAGSGNWMAGYLRFGGATWGYDWTHSGNSQTDGPPMEPGNAEDVILADHIGADVGDYRFCDPHVEWSQPGSLYFDFRLDVHRENNVAYGDGHAETHHHQFDVSLGWPYWEGHYVVKHGDQGLCLLAELR